jgi:hypothetical protein
MGGVLSTGELPRRVRAAAVASVRLGSRRSDEFDRLERARVVGEAVEHGERDAGEG